MKISIVIPTRNRAEFLKYCLATCLASKDPDLEIVVSDNFSVDDTKAVVEAAQDPRLRYVTPGRDVSMRQNFEFALSHATGDYVIFIGDDDGVLPNGIATLRYLIEREAPDVITWRHITYIWPKTNPVPAEGVLKFRYRDFCGPMLRLDPKKVLADFYAAKLVNYRDGANIYHGCVSRKVIEKIKAKGGEYFQGQIPDVNTAISNLTAAESFLWLRNPVTIAGEGEKSNGSAMNSHDKRSEAQAKLAGDFTSLAAEDRIPAEIDLRIRSIPAYVYANLLRVGRDHLGGDFKIDHAAWRACVIEDMKKYPKIHRRWDVLEAFFADADPDYQIVHLADPPELAARDEAAVADLVPVAPKKKRRNAVPARVKENVESVVAWLQAVTGAPYHPTGNRFMDYLAQGFRTIGMRRRFRALVPSDTD